MTPRTCTFFHLIWSKFPEFYQHRFDKKYADIYCMAWHIQIKRKKHQKNRIYDNVCLTNDKSMICSNEFGTEQMDFLFFVRCSTFVICPRNNKMAMLNKSTDPPGALFPVDSAWPWLCNLFFVQHLRFVRQITQCHR